MKSKTVKPAPAAAAMPTSSTRIILPGPTVKNSKPVNNTVLIRKANDLVEARYKFDIWETRLFIKMLTMIRADDRDFNEYKIFINDLIKDFALENSKDTYQRVKDGARKLMTKIIRVLVKDEGQLVELETPIIGAVKRNLVEGDGSYIKLAFYPDMKPFLLELKNRYLVYDFRNVRNLPSPYYVRLYELLKQYEKLGERRFSVTELREILGLTTEYKLYGHLKSKILDKAQAKLLEFTDISFTYAEIKRGKAVEELVFRIQKNRPTNPESRRPTNHSSHHPAPAPTRQTAFFDEHDQPTVAPKHIELPQKSVESPLFDTYFEKLHDWWGISRDVFLKRLDGKTAADLEAAIEFTKSKIQAGKAENPAGVFLDALTKGHRTAAQTQAEKQAERERVAREKQLRLQPLVNEYEGQADNFSHAINEAIRAITAQNPMVTEAVIERIKTTYANLGDRTLTNRTIEDFRKNPMLRALVKAEIMKDYPTIFSAVNERFSPRLQELAAQIRGIEPGYKFN